MRLLDLFSGIGGFSLAASWVWGNDLKIVSFCEIDPFCRKVLKKHWPDVPIIEDIRNHDFTQYRGTVDIISGGFPCQDISYAGKGEGITGNRSGLWFEYARVISEVEPRFIVVENVTALLNRGLSEVLGTLASLRYDAVWHCIPAFYVSSPQPRDRIWIISYPACNVRTEKNMLEASRRETSSFQFRRLYSLFRELEKGRWNSEPASKFLRVAHGLPFAVDRLKGLGNAIVPQVAEVIFRAIKEIEDENH